MRIRSLVAAGLVSLSSLLFSVGIAAAAPVSGDLVKLQDDGNLQTTVDAAVYYVGSDSKRYVFPNSQTYFTWYANFDLVKIASSAELAALPIGGNITYRPGTRMVKITSDPNVYAVEPGGTLRWIQSEQVAIGIYGSLWNKRVDDVPDAFFFNYHLGEPLAAPVFPSGTVVKRSSDNVYFRIDNRNKRKIVSLEVKTALRIQDTFVITTTGDLSDYPDASDITSAETVISDTSQKNVSTLPSQPTISLRLPSTSFFAVGGDATLLELHLSSVKAFTVKRLTAKIDATTDNPATASIDDDKGGLVYQNNAQPNFKLIRFLDAGGAEVFGRKESALDVSQDQSQTFSFTGTFSVPAGEEKVLYLKAQANVLLPTGEGYRVTLPLSGIEIVDGATGLPTPFQPQVDIVGPTLTSLNASLEVSSSLTPGLKTYVRGTKNAAIAGLSFKATTVAPNVIKSVTFQGYIDEEGAAGFLPGTDTDNGTPTTVRDIVPEVSLYSSTGTKLAGPIQLATDGRVTFSGLSFIIQAGQTAKLEVHADISSIVDLETQPNKITFDIVDAAQDMVVVDDKGGSVPAVGKTPNGGVSPGAFSTIVKNGTVAFSFVGGGEQVLAGKEVLLGTLSADLKIDSYKLKTLTFKANGGHATLGDVRLEYPTTGTVTASVIGSFIGDAVTFPNLNIALPIDVKTDIKVFGKLSSKENGAIYGEQIKVRLSPTGPLSVVSQSSSEELDQSRIGSELTIGANTESNLTIRFSKLTATKAGDSPGGLLFRENTSEVLKFNIKTEAEGGARIKKLTFKVLPADASKAGGDNDALERWAKVNGDFGDDDGIVNLFQLVGSNRNIIGEDSSTRIMYSVVQGGIKNSSPSGITSATGDYGLIEYVFNDGSEFSLGAGANLAFSFGIDTSLFASGQDYNMTIDLLGGADLEWTDIVSGSYTPLGGADAAGFPMTGQVTVKQ